jgi:ubiquinone/menaquinone biosynthesis C-methylase UbiE
MSALEKRLVNADRHARRASRRVERLLRRVPTAPGWRCLDVGCGTGAATAHIAATFGLDVTGVDVDPEQIALADARGAHAVALRFRTVPESGLPFADGEFDAVLTRNVTHHVPDWRAALTEMLRVLRIGGYLVYADLVLPPPLAALGESLLGGRAGFPTRRALAGLAVRHGLRTVHESPGLLRHEVVFQKELPASPCAPRRV